MIKINLDAPKSTHTHNQSHTFAVQSQSINWCAHRIAHACVYKLAVLRVVEFEVNVRIRDALCCFFAECVQNGNDSRAM